MSDYEFALFEHDGGGETIEVPYRGVWFIADNGYLSSPCTVPPFKNRVSYAYIIFSEWFTSMRKDMECTFIILTGCFCILRSGVRLRTIEK